MNTASGTTAPVTGTVGYGYDGAGRRTSLTYPSGRQVTYGYTNRGELASVTAWTVGTTQYTYDSVGRLTGIALPNGVTSTLSYDNADRLTRITHARGMTTLEDIQYVLNAVGNRTSMTDAAGMDGVIRQLDVTLDRRPPLRAALGPYLDDREFRRFLDAVAAGMAPYGRAPR